MKWIKFHPGIRSVRFICLVARQLLCSRKTSPLRSNWIVKYWNPKALLFLISKVFHNLNDYLPPPHTPDLSGCEYSRCKLERDFKKDLHACFEEIDQPTFLNFHDNWNHQKCSRQTRFCDCGGKVLNDHGHALVITWLWGISPRNWIYF